MKQTIPRFLILLAVCVSCTSNLASFAQGVYVKHGPNGPVFSDQP